MRIRKIGREDLTFLMELFYICFKDDHYYRENYGANISNREIMTETFRPAIEYCLDHGVSLGVLDGTGRIVSFLLCLDYNRAKFRDPELFRYIFGADSENRLPYFERLHAPIQGLDGDVLYLLSVAARPDLRMRGLASGMLDYLMARYPERYIVSDVSNKSSVPMYLHRSFSVETIDEEYFYVCRAPGKSKAAEPPERALVVVPDTALFDEHGLQYTTVKNGYFAVGYLVCVTNGSQLFHADEGAVSQGRVVRVSRGVLAEYRRLIGGNNCREVSLEDKLLYATPRTLPDSFSPDGSREL